MSIAETSEAPVDHGRRRLLGGPPADATSSAAAKTLPERLVARVTAMLDARPSRRRFLARTAMVGSALAVGPVDFLLRPGTAYGYLCGTCTDGWTAFCCTVNGGRNSCPPGSFVAGWWKADNAAYCCGKARYIIDCNATCPTQCACRCSGAACDGRKTCCNQFRYGQCHQEIACYGPVVCRVALCITPWQYDATCTTTSATDNRTRDHGAPCLDGCNTAIADLYASLGGAGGVLGPLVQAEREVAEGTGRYALYQHGSIFWSQATGAHEQHGPIGARYRALGYHRSPLGYPTTNQTALKDGRGQFNRYQNGVIYWSPEHGAWGTWGAARTLHSNTGGVAGPLGYPTTSLRAWPSGGGTYEYFEGGSIWWGNGLPATWVSAGMSGRYRGLHGPDSGLGWPVASMETYAGGRRLRCQQGSLYERPTGGAFEVHGSLHMVYVSLGEATGPLGWPTADVAWGAEASRRSSFDNGAIYRRKGGSTTPIHGALFTAWTAAGGETSTVGLPRTAATVLPGTDVSRQRFDRGVGYDRPGLGTFLIDGLIFHAYWRLGESTSDLGLPTSGTFADGSLTRCNFEGGQLTYDPATGLVTRTA